MKMIWIENFSADEQKEAEPAAEPEAVVEPVPEPVKESEPVPEPAKEPEKVPEPAPAAEKPKAPAAPSGDKPVVATFNTKKAKSVHDFITFDEFLENLMPKLVETRISTDNTKVKNVWKRNPLTGYFLPMPRPETPPLEM